MKSSYIKLKIKAHFVKAQWEEEIKLHAFLTYVLNEIMFNFKSSQLYHPDS